MGLVQRQIEAAGFSTITLSPMAEVTAAFGVPRLAAVEHPLSQTVGPAGDASRQREVLWAALQALESMQGPGEVLHLPFEWPEKRSLAIKHSEPAEHPPIVGYLKRKPWLMAKLYSGRLPKPG